MAEKFSPELKGVSETLLITLYARACESRRPDGLIRDDKAVAAVAQMEYDFEHLRLHGHDEVAVILRMHEIDRITCEFLARHPAAAVVHLGCGLDTRFERVDNGQVEWFDLDLPPVIELRRELFGGEGPRQHYLAGSAFSDEWLAEVAGCGRRPVLFVSEGVLVYFSEEQVRALFLKLREHFPGAELVCDAQTPFMIWANNLQLAVTQISARLHWGLKRGKDVETWAPGIALLEEWFFFDQIEPRLKSINWMRHIPLMAKSTGIFHYRLDVSG